MKSTKSIIIKSVAGLLLALLASSSRFSLPAVAQEENDPITVGCTGSAGDVTGLANAIHRANAQPGEDTIVLGEECIYTLLGPLAGPGGISTGNGLPVVTSDLVIEGRGSRLERRDSPFPFRLLEVRAGRLTVNNLTMSQGWARPGGGGAILAGPGASLRLTNVRFSSNQADFGGAVAAQGLVFIKDTGFFSNKALAESGGGVFTTGAVLAVNSVFNGNQAAGDGGGVHALGPLTTNLASFKSNSAGRFGGGIYGGATVTLERNLFWGNQAVRGGSGLYLAQVQGGTSLLINNLWADNYKKIDQPQVSTLCLLCDSDSTGKVTVNHNTLANAGPFREKAIEVGRGEARVTNSIITNYDTGVQNREATVTTAHNLYFANFVNEAGNIPPAQSHLIGQDPRFVDPANGRYTLQAGSPALGKANPAASELLLLLDRRGVHRPQGNGPDIGADEFDEGFIPAGHVISLAACPQGEGDVAALVGAFGRASDLAGANRIELGANCIYTLVEPAGEFFGATGLPVVSEYLVIAGNGATIQRSDNAVDFRLMAVDDARLDLRDLTLQNGRVEEYGAGLYVDNFDGPGELLTLTNVTFRGNTITSSYYGGGLYVENSTVTTIERSRFENNQAEEGGGAQIYGASELRLSEVRFSGNTADYGGGLMVYDSQGTIERSRFENNQALEYEGGGLYLYESALKVTGSTFVANSSPVAGGGIAAKYSRLTLDGNTFIRNEAPVGAGLLLEATSDGNLIANNLWVDNVTIDDEASAAITLRTRSSSLEGKVDVFHNTIVSSTQAEGEGVWIGGPEVRLANNIITNHNAGILLFETGAATAEHNLYAGNRFEEAGNVQSSNKLTTDQPIFVDPAQGDFHLRANAAAIDAGMDAGLTTDLAGAPRPFGEGFDIGAYEFGSTPPDPAPDPDPGGEFSAFLPLVVK